MHPSFCFFADHIYRCTRGYLHKGCLIVSDAQRCYLIPGKHNLISVWERDNTLDSPISADKAQIPPTEWGSHLVCSAGPRHSTGHGGGCTEIKFQTVEGDFGIRRVSKAKSILRGLVRSLSILARLGIDSNFHPDLCAQYTNTVWT